jgi:hydroxymethylbilane synthase
VSSSIEPILVGARGSPLSRAQVEEVLQELRRFHPETQFQPLWIETTGDKDLVTSLRDLERTDFFTKEIDALQKGGGCRISIHSAKDLPDPLPEGLALVALTKGVSPADVLVLRDLETVEGLTFGAKIGTSSVRREKQICALRRDFVCVDVRGPIEKRLALLDIGTIDGLVMAEAALIRLKLTTRVRFPLLGERPPLQGQLAIVSVEGDERMRKLFECIDVRAYENSSLLGD